MEDVMTRVERGAAWLDRVRPGWIAQIDLDDLWLSDCTYCVLGQIFGSFHQGLVAASARGDASFWDIWSEERAFVITYSGYEPRPYHRLQLAAYAHLLSIETDEYKDLTAAWKSYILARRVSQKLSAPQPQHQDEGELIHA